MGLLIPHSAIRATRVFDLSQAACQRVCPLHRDKVEPWAVRRERSCCPADPVIAICPTWRIALCFEVAEGQCLPSALPSTGKIEARFEECLEQTVESSMKPSLPRCRRLISVNPILSRRQCGTSMPRTLHAMHSGLTRRCRKRRVIGQSPAGAISDARRWPGAIDGETYANVIVGKRGEPPRSRSGRSNLPP